MNTLQRYTLWVDGLGGLLVGLLVLLISSWLSGLHGLPHGFVLFMGSMNLLYGTSATALAMRSTRPIALLRLLAVANMGWAIACVGGVTWHWESVTAFGLLHLLGEGVYVAALGLAEWHWQRALQTR